jgi:hypothetical protein
LRYFGTIATFPAPKICRHRKPTGDGYYAVFTRSARNNDVANITNPSNQALTLSGTIPPSLRANYSPVFSDTAVAIICQNDTTITLNNAIDADGDRLVYSFGTPYGAFSGGNGVLPNATFSPPSPTITYNVALVSGASATTPFGTGAGNFAILNAATGVAKYGATTQGKYVVAVDVAEYRLLSAMLPIAPCRCSGTLPARVPSSQRVYRSTAVCLTLLSKL